MSLHEEILSGRALRIPDYPLAAAYGDPGCVLLAANESAYPPFAAARTAAQHVLAGVNRYPDPSYGLLRDALSRHYGLAAEQIVVGNGSCDILLAAGDALLNQGDELIYGWPSFAVYPHLAQATGATAKPVALGLDDTYDLAAIHCAITSATKLVVICNPNNPTSTALPQTELAQWVKDMPADLPILIDEAYHEYNDRDDDPTVTLKLLQDHANVILLRTFSKAYGLAALRVGYALCGSAHFAKAFTRVRQPFSTNAVAAAAAVKSLACQAELDERVRETRHARAQLTDALTERGLHVATSHANFCWVDLPNGYDDNQVVHELWQRKVLVRGGTSLGKSGSLRVSCGTDRGHELFLQALDQVLPALR